MSKNWVWYQHAAFNDAVFIATREGSTRIEVLEV